jgi:hypothetical protein
MKYAHIVPNILNQIADTHNDMHLLLAHWAMQNKEYKNFYTQSKVYKILDNSFYELSKNVKSEILLKIAEEMNVQEIVLPDQMYSFKATKKLIQEFFKHITPEHNRFVFQAVVCGKNKKEMIKCFHWMNEHPRIQIISFSRRGCGYGQHDKERYLLVKELAPLTKKPIHLLGANGMTDYFRKWHTNVRSIDSKQYAKTALNVETIELTTKATPQQKKLFQDLLINLKNNEGT